METRKNMKKPKQISATLRFTNLSELKKMLDQIKKQVETGIELIEKTGLNDTMIRSEFSFTNYRVGVEKCIDGKSHMTYKSHIDFMVDPKVPKTK
tara:strand:+ start:10049 stop:10333 length:285 start_codon:yes stop_codon:yes gene_type:complete